jgi:hypothetical protein
MKRLLPFIIILLFTSQCISQFNYGEHYFLFRLDKNYDKNKITRMVSIDKVEMNCVYAYAMDEQQWTDIKKEIPSLIELPHPSSIYYHKMSNDVESVLAWDTYPTYGAYKQLMYNFTVNYPNICKLDTIGLSIQNRQILAVKISSNVNQNQNKPEFFYTSSMHGDELVGYIMTLRLIDYMLSMYNDPSSDGVRITKLINNCEIWINPLANPDGTFWGGDSTVSGARRGNANNVDLNRNFPDRIASPNNDTTGKAKETQKFMLWSAKRNISLSANFHGGAQVVNYPWDNGKPSGQYSMCPDDAWFIMASLRYSLTNPDLMSGGWANGITNGCQWYSVDGGRQDYMYWFHGGREVCIELWNTKLPAGNVLPQRWTNNKESLIAYMELMLKGIRGIVTNAVTGLPIRAKVYADTIKSVLVKTDSITGNYHRMLLAGTHKVICSATGYKSDSVLNVNVLDTGATVVNFALQPIVIGVNEENNNAPVNYQLYQNYPNPFNPVTVISYQLSVSSYATLKIYDIFGKEVITLVNEKLNPDIYNIKFDGTNYSSGVYFYKLIAGDYQETRKMLLLK